MTRASARVSTRPGMGAANLSTSGSRDVVAPSTSETTSRRTRATVRAEPVKGASARGEAFLVTQAAEAREARNRATTAPALERASTSGAHRAALTTIPAGRPADEPPATRRPRAAVREDRVGEAVALSRDGRALLRKVVPRVVRSQRECADAPLDHREGFLLAHIDGVTSIEGLIDICGLPEQDVLTLIQRLRRLRIVTLG